MAKFKYQALKNNTKLVEGEIEASSPREAREAIRKLGFMPTKIYTETPSGTEIQALKAKDAQFETQKVKFLSLSQKIMFTSELETMLSAGIPIMEALNSMETNSPDLKIKNICMTLRLSISAGSTFAQSIKSHYGEVFGPVYTSLVETGENAGELEVTLSRMLVLFRKQDSIKGKIISASIYPCVLILMMLGLLLIFAKLVFPKFASVMAFNGADLPIMAQSIIGAFNFIGNFWWLVLLIFGALVYVVVKMFKIPSIKAKIDNFVLKIPALSDFITYINLSNFMTVMNISYDAGVPIMSGIELAGKTVGNNTIKSKISASANLIRLGKTLTESFERTAVLPHALLSMISAGEKSGTLGKMFHDCAEVIDKKVDLALEAMTRLFEPTVIIIMGIAVLFIMIAFVQAYVGMLGSIF